MIHLLSPQSLISLLSGTANLAQTGLRVVHKAISGEGDRPAQPHQDLRQRIGEFLQKGMEGSFSTQESRRPFSDTIRDIVTPSHPQIRRESDEDITLEEGGGGTSPRQEQVLQHNIQHLEEMISLYHRRPDVCVAYDLSSIALPIPTSDSFFLWSVRLDEVGQIERAHTVPLSQLTGEFGEYSHGYVDIILKQPESDETTKPVLLWYNDQFSGTPEQHKAMRQLFDTSSQERESLLQKHPFFLDDPLFRIGQRPALDNYAPLLRDLGNIAFDQHGAGKTQFQVIFFKELGFSRALFLDQERAGIFPRIEASATIRLDGQIPTIKIRAQGLISHNQDEVFLRGIERVLLYVESLSDDNASQFQQAGVTRQPPVVATAVPEEGQRSGGMERSLRRLFLESETQVILIPPLAVEHPPVPAPERVPEAISENLRREFLSGNTQAIGASSIVDMMSPRRPGILGRIGTLFGLGRPNWKPESNVSGDSHWVFDKGLYRFRMPLGARAITIGREGDEKITGDSRVSAKHVMIKRLGPHSYSLENIGSNVASINEDPPLGTNERCWIKPEDIIKLTDTVFFVFDPIE